MLVIGGPWHRTRIPLDYPKSDPIIYLPHKYHGHTYFAHTSLNQMQRDTIIADMMMDAAFKAEDPCDATPCTV